MVYQRNAFEWETDVDPSERGHSTKTQSPLWRKCFNKSYGYNHFIWVCLKIGYIPNEIAI